MLADTRNTIPALHSLITLVFVASMVLCTRAQAEIRTRDIEYSYANTTLKGFLAWDESTSEKRPGVVVVHEWWGLNDYAKKRAEDLARMGYVALAADMYGEGRSTTHPEDATEMMSAVKKDKTVWIGRARAAVDALRSNSLVDSSKIAAIGYCFGGATVLELAYSGEQLAGVASFHGALTVPTPPEAKAIKTKVLVCHGSKDPFVPDQTARELRTALDDAGVDYQMVYYGGAQHSFTVPTAPGANGLAYSPSADKRSQSHLKAFFTEIFGVPER